MVLSMDRWVGKTAIVTGASSGIGAAIVDQLVDYGLQVVGVGRRIELIEQRSQDLSNKKGKLHPYQADISREEEILKLFEWVESNLGPVNILINNAGTSKELSLIEADAELFRHILDVNVIALTVATNQAIKQMQKHQINGHIVHINSITGHQVTNFPGLNIYPASKHAVTALTESFRQELNRLELKIKVTSVSPGLVATEMTTLKKEIKPETLAIIEKCPIMQAEDIADAVVYALSTPEHVQVHELTIKPVGEYF